MVRKGIKNAFFEFLQVEERVVRTLGRTNQLIELDLNGFGVAVLCVLNQEHHQERDDRGSGIDNELPRIAEREDRSCNGPDQNDRDRERKDFRTSAEARRRFGEAGVPRTGFHIGPRPWKNLAEVLQRTCEAGVCGLGSRRRLRNRGARR